MWIMLCIYQVEVKLVDDDDDDDDDERTLCVRST